MFDVSDPTAPVLIGALETPGAFLEVVGHPAYAADASTLRVIDVSDPSAPREIGQIAVPVTDVDVVGTRAYVVGAVDSESFSLAVIDVADPTLPVEVGAVVMPGSATDVEVAENLVYVAGYFGLRIFDASDPTAPVEIGSVETPGPAFAIEIVGALAYVGGRLAFPGFLLLVEVSDPSAPVEIGMLLVSPWVTDVKVANGLVYLGGVIEPPESSFVGMFQIIDLGPEYTTEVGVEVGVDIKPGRAVNRINPRSRRVIRVAILGSETFDVADVDVSTLAFGPSGAPLAHRTRRGPRSKDVNHDGFPDLLAHFRTQETGIAFGDEKACLTGKTRNGTAFEGCDSVSTVPRHGGDRRKRRGASAG